MDRISARFRWALAGKGALLYGLAALFLLLAIRAGSDGVRGAWLRLALVPPFVLFGAFLGWAGRFAVADVIRGRTTRVEHAVALPSRRAGYSLRLPDGHYAEFILFNPWGPLAAGRQYTLVMGKHSRVIVEPPLLEP
jgi:hypothetical protein